MQENQEMEEKEIEETDKKEKKRHSFTSTRNGLYLRTVIGFIIVYYGYSIVKDINDTTGNQIPLYLFAALFAVVGIFIAVQSIIKLIKKDYSE